MFFSLHSTSLPIYARKWTKGRYGLKLFSNPAYFISMRDLLQTSNALTKGSCGTPTSSHTALGIPA
jgi:hypothetical protein